MGLEGERFTVDTDVDELGFGNRELFSSGNHFRSGIGNAGVNKIINSY